MSMFMGSTAQYAHVRSDPEKIKMAQMQFEAMSATFNRVLRTCEKKCIPHEYGENELNTGEACCVDRCVAKYVRVNSQLGTELGQRFSNPLAVMPEYKTIERRMLENAEARTS